MVNRCFAADDGQPDKLMAMLDRDVTVIDPREAEAVLRREFQGVRTGEDVDPAQCFLPVPTEEPEVQMWYAKWTGGAA